MTPVKDSETPWVLMAIVYGGGAKRANLDSIISAADYVNHAVISYEEISGGLSFLLKKGIISRIGRYYKLSTKTAVRYQSIKTNRIAAYWKETEEIVEESKKLQKSKNIESVKPIKKSDYENAVRCYLERNKVGP